MGRLLVASRLLLFVSLLLFPAAETDAMRALLFQDVGSAAAPRDMAVEPRVELVAVVDAENHTVLLRNGDFSPFLSLGGEGVADGEFVQPSGVTFSSNRRLVVSDTGNHRIQVFDDPSDLDANLLFSFGARGSGAGQFDHPLGLGADDDGRIYVADSGNARVQVFFPDGTLERVIEGPPGGGRGRLVEPADVAVCSQLGPERYRGRIYVVDRAANRVQVFSPLEDGARWLSTFGREGEDRGELGAPSGIALDHQCNVYVADPGNHRLQMFDSEGGFLELIGEERPGGLYRPGGVAVESISGFQSATGVYLSSESSSGLRRYQWIDYDLTGDGLVDADGDSLPDLWEIRGIDWDFDGQIDLDLSALGADAGRMDIFVEVDQMPGHELDSGSIDELVRAFADAPVINSNGTRGVSLHILADDLLPHFDSTFLWIELDAFKNQFFGTQSERASPNAEAIVGAKRLAFHYAVFVHAICDEFDVDGDGQCGRLSGSTGRAELGGDDFVVSFSPHGWPAANRASTFMHELGHNLGLRHGGGDDINCKPNYLSVMSYTFQLSRIPTGGPAAGRIGTRLDYSRQVLPTLDEAALDERSGLQDGMDWTIWNTGSCVPFCFGPGTGPLNWNNVNGIEAFIPPVELNDLGLPGCGTDASGADSIQMGEVMIGFDDWAQLDLNFRKDSDFYAGSHDVAEQPVELNLDAAEAFLEGFDRVFKLADCNRNGLGDAMEIADGSSQDTDGSGVPDECELISVPCELQGTAAGGSVSVTFAGFTATCLVTVNTLAGETAEMVAEHLADAINSDLCAMQQGITATASDASVTLDSVLLHSFATTIADSGLEHRLPLAIPALSSAGWMAMVVLLSLAGWILNRRRLTGGRRP